MPEGTGASRPPPGEDAFARLVTKRRVSHHGQEWLESDADKLPVSIGYADRLITGAVLKLRAVLSERKRQATTLLSEPAAEPTVLEDSLVVAATRFWIAAAEHEEERAPGTKKTTLRSLEDEVVTVMTQYMNVIVGHASATVASSSDKEGIDQDQLRPWSDVSAADRGGNLNAGISYPRAGFLDDIAGMYGPPDLLELRRPACGHRGVQQDSDNIRQYFRVASESLGAVPKTDRVRD